MSELLKIAELGNPVLRKKSKNVEILTDEDIFLIENMKYTVEKVSGVGLAAPQVSQLKRLFIIASKPNKRYPHAPKMEPQAIINPRILDRSQETVKDWEGCLSIPGLRGCVPRSKSISVEFYTILGERKTQKFDDFIARIFQHEFDHLEGIVFLDRLEATKDLVTEKEYLNILSENKKPVS